METLAPTREERGLAMSQNTIGPRVSQIETAVAAQVADWLGNADKIEKALDDIGDIRRWPLFAMLLSVVVTEQGERQRAAINRIRTMLSGALTDEATAVVMADLGVS